MALFSLPLKGELTVHHTTATSTAPRFTTSFDIIPSTAHLSNQLGNTARLLDLLLSVPAEVAGTDDNRDLGDTALAQDLGVAEGEEVDDRGGVGLLAAHVGFALLGRDEGPQLFKTIQSATHPPQILFRISSALRGPIVRAVQFHVWSTYLVEVDGRPPVLLVGLAVVAHAELTEVAGMVLVEVGAVVVLATGHTATTGVLAVLANATVTGLHMTAAERKGVSIFVQGAIIQHVVARRDGFISPQARRRGASRCRQNNRMKYKARTHCFLVFEKRVGMLTTVWEVGDEGRQTVGESLRGNQEATALCAPGP